MLTDCVLWNFKPLEISLAREVVTVQLFHVSIRILYMIRWLRHSVVHFFRSSVSLNHRMRHNFDTLVSWMNPMVFPLKEKMVEKKKKEPATKDRLQFVAANHYDLMLGLVADF